MKKAYELSTLTGTQVLLLVVSETGLVYTFTTAKLQPLVTQPEGKNLIQACLNAPHGSLPSSMPVGTPMGRSSGQMNMPSPTASNNLPGGLAISGGAPGNSVKDDDDGEDDEVSHGGRAAATGEKRRRRASSTTGPASNASAASRGGGGATSPHSPNSSIPPAPLSIPPHNQGQPQQPTQISLGGSPTSPNQQHQQVPPSPQYQGGSYGHHPSHHHGGQDNAGMYGSHMMPPPGPYSYPGPGGPGGAGTGQGMTGLAQAAAQQHGHWAGPPPQVGQTGHYGRR